MYRVWDPDPVFIEISHFFGKAIDFTFLGFHIKGPFSIVWYGVLFALGFLISQQILYYIYKKDKVSPIEVDTLSIYMVLATFIGARLGHVLFYNPDYYFANPMKILAVREGGLASHGAAVGILLALWLYCYSNKKSYLWVLDRMVIVITFTGCLIRMGNYINSEIIGKQTHSDYGIVFARQMKEVLQPNLSDYESIKITTTDKITSPKPGIIPVNVLVKYKKGAPYNMQREYEFYGRQLQFTLLSKSSDGVFYHDINTPIPYNLYKSDGDIYAEFQTYGIVRHPTQIYESVFYFLFFLFLFFVWVKKRNTMNNGYIFSLFLMGLWAFRFSIEFLKENQEDFESKLILNMGQILSIPLIGAGIYLFYKIKKKTIEKQPQKEGKIIK
ncbi:MAG: prolipoprotein diacylglyceryl transferase [Chitinophagaceae bacterium]|nr:prolipoprotein diacylglyceryl transferase [Chitinophagaceae bacterium]